MLLAGFAVFYEARQASPVLGARLNDLDARMVQARWMADHMDHGGGFERPSSMMPGMPDAGYQRLSVEIAFRNVGQGSADYHGEEFSLVTDRGRTYEIFGADLGTAKLARGQSLNTSLYFDVEVKEDPGRMRLVWERGNDRVYMPLPAPPDHYHARPRGDVVWPDDVTILLPIGNHERGAEIYATAYGCIACHGDPKTPGSNLIGPHLGTVGTLAATRVDGREAPQYLYESILAPNRYIVEECRDGVPCFSPSAMPDYADILSLQDMADLVSFLMLRTGDESASS